MSSSSSNLFSLARSKLSLSGDSKDSFSLHRWVLLKNSIIQSIPLVSTVSPPISNDDEPEPDDEPEDEPDTDSFMFPDAGMLVEPQGNATEAAWLDSLLETLGDEEEDDFSGDTDVNVSIVDDEDIPQSPTISPNSSSDDLISQCYYPYLNPYPPYSPQTIPPYHLTTLLAPSPSSPPPYVDPLPYSYLDDLDDFPPVPDTIEDTSDDESDTPPTPGQSLSSLSLDPASIPLPVEHSRLRHSTPHIYYTEDEYLPGFEPLPFSPDHHSPVDYPECC